MNDAIEQLQQTDYTAFIAGSYAVTAIVLLWILWRSISHLRTEKRALERVKPS